MVAQISMTNLQSPAHKERPAIPRRPSLKLLFITTTLVSTLLLCFVYINTVQESPSREIQNGNLIYTFRMILNKLQNSVQGPMSTRTSRPRILLWNSFFSQKDYLLSPSAIDCPVDCVVTSNRSLLNSSEAIIFHLRDTAAEDLPEWRNNKQRWVLFNKEAPPQSPAQVLRALNGKIHWTATYRNDSDIWIPYGKVVARKNKNHSEIPKFKQKKDLVCWVVSHCNTASSRETYVEVLRKHVAVATYGRCGNLSCDAKNCYREISESCMFYLSFENSLCRDYMTEKVFNALKTSMVPIVMGGSQYSLFLPNHSYIDVFDHYGPIELASFLKMLDKNPDKYMEYHSWKKDYEIDTSQSWSCDLCKMLHDPSLQWTTYEDLVKWWFDDAVCFSWVQYFENY